MKVSTVRRFFALLASLAISCNAIAAIEYHGFLIDESAQPLSAEVMASLKAQLDVVDAVGLPPKVVESIRQTNIVVDPSLRGNPAIFTVRKGTGVVVIQPIAFSPDKPILLHELLHAYHAKVLGLGRTEIDQAYQRAKHSDQFPPRFQSSHFLENAKEFFAVTGTLYLFGDIQQPPFKCAALTQLGEDYLAFLAAQFGPHQCPVK